jgi:hypothetical protein
MKKSFIALCATVLAFAACQKDEVKVVPELKVSSETAITVEKDGGIFNVEFESNVAWTAALDVEKEAATLNLTSGTAEDKKVKVTVNPLTEDNATRVITLTLTPENGEGVKVVFTQNGPYVPYFKVSTSELTFGKEGGSQSFTIDTNCDKSKITVDAPTVGTIQVNEAFTEATFTMPANTAWAEVSDRVKFTIEDIQDPVLDEDGNDTGETAAHVEKVYAYQDGAVSVSSVVNVLPGDVATDGEYSVAVAGGYIFVCDHTNVFAFDSEKGTFVMKVDMKGAIINCLTTDDAGNIVLAIGGGTFGESFTVMAIPVATMSDATTYKTIINCVNQFGYGLFGLQAAGDVTGKAVVSAFVGAGAEGYGVAWQVNDGKCEADYTKYSTLPGTNYWTSHHGTLKFLTEDIAGGVLYTGYDQIEHLYYNPGFENADWADVCDFGATGNEGPLALDVVEYNGHKYAVVAFHAYFTWSNASVAIIQIDDPESPVLIATLPTAGETEFVGTDANTAACAEVEDGKLAIYVVGQGYRVLSKVIIAE